MRRGSQDLDSTDQQSATDQQPTDVTDTASPAIVTEALAFGDVEFADPRDGVNVSILAQVDIVTEVPGGDFSDAFSESEAAFKPNDGSEPGALVDGDRRAPGVQLADFQAYAMSLGALPAATQTVSDVSLGTTTPSGSAQSMAQSPAEASSDAYGVLVASDGAEDFALVGDSFGSALGDEAVGAVTQTNTNGSAIIGTMTSLGTMSSMAVSSGADRDVLAVTAGGSTNPDAIVETAVIEISGDGFTAQHSMTTVMMPGMSMDVSALGPARVRSSALHPEEAQANQQPEAQGTEDMSRYTSRTTTQTTSRTTTTSTRDDQSTTTESRVDEVRSTTSSTGNQTTSTAPASQPVSDRASTTSTQGSTPSTNGVTNTSTSNSFSANTFALSPLGTNSVDRLNAESAAPIAATNGVSFIPDSAFFGTPGTDNIRARFTTAFVVRELSGTEEALFNDIVEFLIGPNNPGGPLSRRDAQIQAYDFVLLQAPQVGPGDFAGDDNISTIGGGPGYIVDLLGNNRITAGREADVIRTGAGNDRIRDQGGNADIFDLGGNNVIDTGDGEDLIITGDGDDFIDTRTGNKTIDAGNGRNTVRTLTGNDFITTGNGNDDIDASEGFNIVLAGEGDNRVRGGNDFDAVLVGSGSDSVDTSNGDSGNPGIQVVSNRTSQAELLITITSPPFDTPTFDFSAAVVPITGGSEEALLAASFDLRDFQFQDSINTFGLPTYDVLAEFGQFFAGSRPGVGFFNLPFPAFLVNNVIKDLGGSDDLRGGVGDDLIFSDVDAAAAPLSQFIFGGDVSALFFELFAGDDFIRGGLGDNIIVDFAGNNDIATRDGDDIVLTSIAVQDVFFDPWTVSAPANDTIDTGNGEDFIDSGTGNDEIDPGRRRDIVFSGFGEDSISGSEGLDAIFLGMPEFYADRIGFLYPFETDFDTDVIIYNSVADLFDAGTANPVLPSGVRGNEFDWVFGFDSGDPIGEPDDLTGDLIDLRGVLPEFFVTAPVPGGDLTAIREQSFINAVFEGLLQIVPFFVDVEEKLFGITDDPESGESLVDKGLLPPTLGIGGSPFPSVLPAAVVQVDPDGAEGLTPLLNVAGLIAVDAEATTDIDPSDPVALARFFELADNFILNDSSAPDALLV